MLPVSQVLMLRVQKQFQAHLGREAMRRMSPFFLVGPHTGPGCRSHPFSPCENLPELMRLRRRNALRVVGGRELT